MYEIVRDKITQLVLLSRDHSAELLIKHIEKLPPTLVVNQLKSEPQLLHWYLLYICMDVCIWMYMYMNVLIYIFHLLWLLINWSHNLNYFIGICHVYVWMYVYEYVYIWTYMYMKGCICIFHLLWWYGCVYECMYVCTSAFTCLLDNRLGLLYWSIICKFDCIYMN